MDKYCSDPERPDFTVCEERRTLGGKTYVVAAGVDYTGRIDCPSEAGMMYLDGFITSDERDYMIALIPEKVTA